MREWNLFGTCVIEKYGWEVFRAIMWKGCLLYCHGAGKLLAILLYSHSQKSFLGQNFVVDKYVCNVVWKFRDEYDVCCFTFI